jgi:hypothetical protein
MQNCCRGLRRLLFVDVLVHHERPEYEEAQRPQDESQDKQQSGHGVSLAPFADLDLRDDVGRGLSFPMN